MPKRPKPPTGPIEQHIGKQLAKRRRQMGLEVDDVSKAIGTPVGTVDKFEAGTAFIGLEHLQNLANTLDVPISYFFKGITDTSDDPKSLVPEGMSEDETLGLVRAYYGIFDDETRKSVLALMKSVADEAP